MVGASWTRSDKRATAVRQGRFSQPAIVQVSVPPGKTSKGHDSGGGTSWRSATSAPVDASSFLSASLFTFHDTREITVYWYVVGVTQSGLPAVLPAGAGGLGHGERREVDDGVVPDESVADDAPATDVHLVPRLDAGNVCPVGAEDRSQEGLNILDETRRAIARFDRGEGVEGVCTHQGIPVAGERARLVEQVEAYDLTAGDRDDPPLPVERRRAGDEVADVFCPGGVDVLEQQQGTVVAVGDGELGDVAAVALADGEGVTPDGGRSRAVPLSGDGAGEDGKEGEGTAHERAADVGREGGKRGGKRISCVSFRGEACLPALCPRAAADACGGGGVPGVGDAAIRTECLRPGAEDAAGGALLNPVFGENVVVRRGATP